MKNYKYLIVSMRKGATENSLFDYNAWLYTENQLKHQCNLWADSIQQSTASKQDVDIDEEHYFPFKIQLGSNGRELEFESWEQFYGDIVREVEKVDSFRFTINGFFVCIKSVEDSDSMLSDNEPESTEEWRKRRFG